MSESEQTRVCTHCHQEKGIEEYYQGTLRGKPFRYRTCKTCYKTRRNVERWNRLEVRKDTHGTEILFGRHCGGCGKRIKHPSRHRGNLCNTCSRPAVDREQYIQEYAESMGDGAAVSSCPGCAFIQVCRVRVKASLWTVCEMPDRADLERAALMGIITDGRQITVRKDQVRDKMVWPGWWPDTASIGEGQSLTLERVNKESLR